jgi:diguanylate cyclase (GGDEF)-like protein
MKILLADDSKTALSLIMNSLQELGHEVLPAINGGEAVNIFQEQRPDLIILDVVMEGMNGFECAKNIRSISTNDWIPIIFLSSSVDDESIAKGIDAGGDDYLTKPVSEVTLAAKIKAMQRISDMRKNLFIVTQKLMVLSATDTLTGIYNRFQFNKTILEKIAQSARYKRKLAVFFLDLDKFKSVNDTLGHQIGDLLLVAVTRRLKLCIREDDFLARLGGDEFAIILSDLEQYDRAALVAQKIIDTLAPSYTIEGLNIISSFSIGISCYPKDGCSQEELLKNADTAMYAAKKSAGNNYKYFTKNQMVHDVPTIQEEEKTLLNKIEPSFPLINSHNLLVLNCIVNRTRICIDLLFIKKIIPLAQLELMPNSPDYVVGLLNLSHKTVPIIDIGRRLNLKRSSVYSLETPILLCSNGVNELGFIVDTILGLEDVALDKHSYFDKLSSIILATLTINSELSLLINMELIFTTGLNNSSDFRTELR